MSSFSMTSLGSVRKTDILPLEYHWLALCER